MPEPPFGHHQPISGRGGGRDREGGGQKGREEEKGKEKREEERRVNQGEVWTRTQSTGKSYWLGAEVGGDKKEAGQGFPEMVKERRQALWG